ncbi:MAG: dihydrolipoyl dehydrogenase family protein, partial [Gemmatimonadaceae bacterium]
MKQDLEGRADFDVLVVGTGGAGVAAAIQAAGMSAKVGIVESGTLGGTCVNVGCIPSKNLIEAAAHYHTARNSFPGIAPCKPDLDWRAVIGQKDELVAELRQAKYADVLASYPGVALLTGRATLLGGGRVRVGDAEHRARKVVIATGASPAIPPIPGLAQAQPLDSTTVMELEELPKSMIVLGGSAVGLELGQTFARFGTKVIVVELTPRLLPNEDETISEALREHLAEDGIDVHTGVTTTRVERDGSEVVVHVRQGALTGQLRAEQLLVATGRRPNTRDMGLEDAGVALTKKGFVRVDATMRTTNPNVYAAGDVTGGPGYVYVAAAGGRVAAENALKSLSPTGTPSDEPRELDLSAVPNVTFTSPQV